MKLKSVLLILIFALTPFIWAQDATTQAPAGSQMRAENRQHMMEMHKQQMEAMKADVAKMKSSLADMKANLLTIKDTNEMARWRSNVDLWGTMIGHMEQMQKHMEMMGPGTMGHGVSGPDWAARRRQTSRSRPFKILARSRRRTTACSTLIACRSTWASYANDAGRYISSPRRPPFNSAGQAKGCIG